jgi:hypothetical protein
MFALALRVALATPNTEASVVARLAGNAVTFHTHVILQITHRNATRLTANTSRTSTGRDDVTTNMTLIIPASP